MDGGMSATFDKTRSPAANTTMPSILHRLTVFAEAIRSVREFGAFVALALIIVAFSLIAGNFWSYTATH